MNYTRLIPIVVGMLLYSTHQRAVAQEDAPLLTGPIPLESILDLHGWFGEDFRSFKPNPQVLELLAAEAKELDVLCILGTWCDDSRREVPRMLTILQAMGLKPESISLIGVDREKRSPGGEAAKHNVSLVPTFIIHRSGLEIGRIIEKPSVTLEHDLLAMLRGEPPAAPAKQTTDRPAYEPHKNDPNLPPDPEQQKPADGVEGEIRTQDPPPGADAPRFRNR